MQLVKKLLTIIILMGVVSANAADKWHIGFNEPFVAGYMQSIGYTCFGCPTNTYTASYNEISSRLLDLASNQHVGMYREIIPVSMLHPTLNEIRHSAAIDLIALYSNYDLNLVIAFGLPIPQWMTSNNNVLRPMPSDATAWTILKNHLAKEMGDFVLALWNSPKIRRDWLQTKVFIEGFNEFDSIQDASGSNIYSSPARAADLQNGIQWYLNYYDLSIQTLMPSLAGVYSGAGYSSLTPSQKIGTFMIDYYAASGSGRPNAHIYTGPNSTEIAGYTEILNNARDSINIIWQMLPTDKKSQLVIGEIGAADRVNPYCEYTNTQAATLEVSERDHLYRAIAQDSQINSQASMIMFWRLMNLPVVQIPGTDRCEAFYGVVHADNSGYKNVGNNLFQYLLQP